ncbi:winged helix-turn-helix transcriptional regulator [Sediminispirochaeta smaragdinae]|uniref:Transcriptional regulator, HxlR family n=1 Tax=Sediminispirochaeta smaragdinae (strain DSM 11293 / JCM 15392 / SEBR 4228) TaxID=573413 RepID=E1R248_SEDSS|nr:helix-turn-helix domain-containing protein [Sediminispirochaeta smaragdinae]ADK81933.1 transcriptional regulator, HxlR family [Sediminispirochaeta smaragdinae DSM 11293]
MQNDDQQKVLDCPVRSVLADISGKWNTLIIIMLAERPYRFGQLRRHIPDISQRMLTQTLRNLQRCGYVNREVFPTKPPSVEYSLTDLGRSISEPLQALIQWAELHSDAVKTARKNYDMVENRGGGNIR